MPSTLIGRVTMVGYFEVAFRFPKIPHAFRSSLVKRFVLMLFLAFTVTALQADDYTLGPDSQTHNGVPKGR